jgi:pyridoxal phosphatase
MNESSCESFVPSSSVGAVVVGMSSDFTYSMLFEATCYLRDPECKLIATNRDAFDVLAGGVHQPAAGAMVAALEAR